MKATDQSARAARKGTSMNYAAWRQKNLTDLFGKIAVVTGANSGLGFEVAYGLAERGAALVLACRDPKKAEDARARLIAAFPHAAVDFLPLDLASLSSVTGFAAELKNKHPQIDLFVHCAGVYYPREKTTADGYPMTVGVNALGTVRLSEATLPLLSKDGRAVFVTSLTDRRGRIGTSPLADDADNRAAYCRSKYLLSGYVCQKAAERGEKGPIFVAAHPGVTKTPLLSRGKANVPLGARISHAFLYLFTHSPEKAALSILTAAAGPAVKNGDYIGPRGPFGVSGYPHKTTFCRRIRRAVQTKSADFIL